MLLWNHLLLSLDEAFVGRELITYVGTVDIMADVRPVFRGALNPILANFAAFLDHLNKNADMNNIHVKIQVDFHIFRKYIPDEAI